MTDLDTRILDAAQESAREYSRPQMHVGTVPDRLYDAHVRGWAACREFLEARLTPAALLAELHEAMPEDVREHWERAEERREINGFWDCVCYLCRTLATLKGETL